MKFRAKHVYQPVTKISYVTHKFRIEIFGFSNLLFLFPYVLTCVFITPLRRRFGNLEWRQIPLID